MNKLTNDIGDILDTEQPSHCICIDGDYFNPSDCSSKPCRCCSDRCGELSDTRINHPTPSHLADFGRVSCYKDNLEASQIG